MYSVNVSDDARHCRHLHLGDHIRRHHALAVVIMCKIMCKTCIHVYIPEFVLSCNTGKPTFS